MVLDLGDTVAKMKRDFGVDQVLAWHAMSGYWAGVQPDAPEMAPFGPHVTKLLVPEGVREVDPEVWPCGEIRMAHVLDTPNNALWHDVVQSKSPPAPSVPWLCLRCLHWC